MEMKCILPLLVVVLMSCDPPPPAPPPAEPQAPALRIAYNVFTNSPKDNYEIFVMDMEGKNKRNITNTPGVEWVYASHGDRLYFLSDRDTCHRCYFLYEMDATGGNLRRLSDRQLQDSWVASRMNGTEFLVDPKGIRDTAFFLIDAKGLVADTLYHGLAYANDPCFSPDGEQVVFRGSGKKFKEGIGFLDELYVINTDGSDLHQLTHYPAADTSAEWWQYHAGPPFWDANTNRISFMSMRKGNYSIFSINPDGSDERQLTGDSLSEGWHAWSPDGEWLVFNASDRAETWFDIALISKEGGEAMRLTTDTLFEQAPVFVEVPR